MRPAVSAPRSARISSFSISSIVASSSWRLATTCAMAPPSAEELRLRPTARRCHQGVAVSVASAVLSFIRSRCDVSRRAVVVGAVRDSGSAMSAKASPPKALPAANLTAEEQEMVSRLLYRDGLMLVVDKPPGIAVHRGPKGGESLEDHFGTLRFGLPRAPALAHRLDRDTSGCLALGRHRKALAELGRLFRNGAIGKTYWAVVEGGPAEDRGRIDVALGRKDVTRGWWMKPDPAGQPATTDWRVLGRGANSAWLAL